MPSPLIVPVLIGLEIGHAGRLRTHAEDQWQHRRPRLQPEPSLGLLRQGEIVDHGVPGLLCCSFAARCGFSASAQIE